MITNSQAGTSVHEVASGIYRISTPLATAGGDYFSFNQYLIVDDAPLLFHTGPRGLFPLVQEAIGAIMPLQSLRYIGFSHFEADECGGLNQLLAAAPAAQAVCGWVGAMTSVRDFADRPPRELTDGEELSLGSHRVKWLDTPHMPHAWDCGLMMESTTRTLLCSDLFAQGGRGEVAVTESDIFDRSERFRKAFDYYTHGPQTKSILERLAREEPTTLACMHGSAWRGDGAALLRALGSALGEVH